MKIIGLFPLTGNGGIASWTKEFRKSFPDESHQFSFVDVAPAIPRTGGYENFFHRAITGIISVNRIIKDLESLVKKSHYDILHTTTSGSLGSYRDLRVANFCKKYGIKTIMHCRYGCIIEAIKSKGCMGWLLRKSMKVFDQIWVLDSKSYNALREIEYTKNKVFLMPNSINVTEPLDKTEKEYKSIAFCGNLIPSKGLYELVEAAKKTDVLLHIIGPGTPKILSRIKQIAGSDYQGKIRIYGKLPNEEAVKMLKKMEIVALPTYYKSEAFPISIIEAMSLSKLVISCRQAAVPDILTALDGTPCGMLVEQRSADAIVEAINWCQTHTVEADEMCRKAYEKVYASYRKEVVYDIYRQNYKKLLGYD